MTIRKKGAVAMILAIIMLLSACGSSAVSPTPSSTQTPNEAPANTGKVTIYTPTEDYLIEYMQQRLDAAFPDTEINIEYYHTGDLASKLAAERTDSECDIVFDCEYGYLESLSDNFITLDFVDAERFVPDMQVESGKYMPVDRYSGSCVVNLDVLDELGLEKPTSYNDLLKPEYKGLIEMPGPNLSSTGYLFLKSLVNAWGEDEAFAYFEKLNDNILQYVSGGSTPIKDLLTGEIAIGLGLTFKAVDLINEGANLEIIYFEEGAPYTPAGLAVVDGKNRAEVIDVVKYFYSDIIQDYLDIYLPEQILVGQVNTVENYPTNIPYADMSHNTPDVKADLLAKWPY